MAGKCANPECGVAFQYFRDGRLFRFDLSDPSAPARIGAEGAAHRRVEDFWLCGTCASKMTLVLEDGVGVRTRPLPHSVGSVKVSIDELKIRQAEA